jgi:hypothetical protein
MTKNIHHHNDSMVSRVFISFLRNGWQWGDDNDDKLLRTFEIFLVSWLLTLFLNIRLAAWIRRDRRHDIIHTIPSHQDPVPLPLLLVVVATSSFALVYQGIELVFETTTIMIFTTFFTPVPGREARRARALSLARRPFAFHTHFNSFYQIHHHYHRHHDGPHSFTQEQITGKRKRDLKVGKQKRALVARMTSSTRVRTNQIKILTIHC